MKKQTLKLWAVKLSGSDYDEDEEDLEIEAKAFDDCLVKAKKIAALIWEEETQRAHKADLKAVKDGDYEGPPSAIAHLRRECKREILKINTGETFEYWTK